VPFIQEQKYEDKFEIIALLFISILKKKNPFYFIEDTADKNFGGVKVICQLFEDQRWIIR